MGNWLGAGLLPLALRALKMLEELSRRDQRELADIKRR